MSSLPFTLKAPSRDDDWMARLPVLTEVAGSEPDKGFRPDVTRGLPQHIRPSPTAVAAVIAVDGHQAGGVAATRLARLLDYVQEAERMGRRTSHHLPLDGGFCTWEHELRNLPGVSVGAGTPESAWMRVERIQEVQAAALPEILRGWITTTNDPARQPRLHPSRENLDGQTTEYDTLSENSKAALDGALSAYNKSWRGWAVSEQRRRQTTSLYAKLFALQQSLESETSASPVDLVWGVGIASWRSDVRTPIRYPLITKLVEITLDTATLAIEVRPRDAEPRLELDPFADVAGAGLQQVEQLTRMLMHHESFDFSPFSTSGISPVLRTAVTHLDAQGSYLPEDDAWRNGPRRPADGGEHLQVSDSWVLFTRPRGVNFLLDDLQRLRTALNTAIIPHGPASIVMEPSTTVAEPAPIQFRGVSLSPDQASFLKSPDLFFPKPYNDEQVAVAANLERYPGVVVQGPPGTGKTHTIANIICHYLATGRTVLVTSKGEPALAVLRDHIPEGIRDLVVSLLTNERDGMKQFEAAISRISGEVARIDVASLAARVRDLEHRAATVHLSLGAVDGALRDIADNHMDTVLFRGADRSASDLARLVVEESSAHSWMEPIAWENSADETIDDEMVRQIAQARQRLGQHLGDQMPAVATDGCPSVEVLVDIHSSIHALRESEAKLANSEIQASPAPGVERIQLQEFYVKLRKARNILEAVKGGWAPSDWDMKVLQFATGEDKEEAVLAFREVLDRAQGVLRERKVFVGKPVKMPHVDHDARILFRAAIDAKAAGKNPFGLFAFKMKKVAKPLLDQITMKGSRIQSIEDWGHARDYLDHQNHVLAAINHWNTTAGELELPLIENVKDLKILLGHYQRGNALLGAVEELSAFLADGVEPLFDVQIEQWLDPESWRAWSDHAKAWAHQMTLAGAAQKREEILLWAQNQPESVRESVERFTLDLLGRSDIDADALRAEWTYCVREIDEASEMFAAAQKVSEVSGAIRSAGAPHWADQLARSPVSEDDDPWVRDEWRDAWSWSRARDWLGRIDARVRMKELQGQRKQHEAELAQVYGQQVEARTWMHLVNNATPAVRAALNAYMNAIRMLGKGTGVRANRYRKEARDAMAKAYKAVPCWIMPHWRVSEALPSDIGAFDLVIIDEASQSDLWALPSLLRGKKIMIVGDDQQVSPDGIGLEEDKVQDLYRRFLGDQVFGAEMTPEKSIYDLARVAFASSQVMLREHFRCVPSIIDFSNNEFYDGEIRALRLPTASERIDPALVDVRVLNGARDPKSKLNRPEARAIVDQVKAICADPAMAGKTIGVVSLLGHDQAQLIDVMIRTEVDAREIVDRAIACGDARTFQGKERDIMLLSLVIDKTSTTAATRREFQQRYNVAASRARDQMWLFRSVDLADLNPEDLRAKLITHFQPDAPAVRAAALVVPNACETALEQSLYETLNSLGYRVRPRVMVGSLSIDLVVEGSTDARLAIECDGDRGENSDGWDAAMRRQRVLERAGWTFWRCFAATFTLRSAECIADLMRTLEGMGISPSGSVSDHSANRARCEHRQISVDLRPEDAF